MNPSLARQLGFAGERVLQQELNLDTLNARLSGLR